MIQLFLVADLVCAVAAPPVFLGLMRKDLNAIIRAPSELGALFGAICGFATVFIIGAANDIGTSELNNNIDTSPTQLTQVKSCLNHA